MFCRLALLVFLAHMLCACRSRAEADLPGDWASKGMEPEVHLTFRADGTASYRENYWGKPTRKAGDLVWRVDREQLCTRPLPLASGPERCIELDWSEDRKQFCMNGGCYRVTHP